MKPLRQTFVFPTRRCPRSPSHGYFPKLCGDHSRNISSGCRVTDEQATQKALTCCHHHHFWRIVMTSTTDKIKGAANEVAGSVKKGVGEALGNPETSGRRRRAEAQGRSSVGRRRRQGRGQEGRRQGRQALSKVTRRKAALSGRFSTESARRHWRTARARHLKISSKRIGRSRLIGAARCSLSDRRIHGGSHERHHLSRWSYRGHHGHSFLPRFALSGKKRETRP